MKRIIVTAAVIIASVSPALAVATVAVPEVGATGAVVAIAAIAAGGALAWERRFGKKD